MKKRFSDCWRYKLQLGITPSTDKCQLIITEQLDDADNPWAYEDLDDVAGDQTEVRTLTMPDDPNELLSSASSVDSETEPTFFVSHTHVSTTAHTQVDPQGAKRWDPVYSHTVAVVELEMDDLTSEQQMSTSSVVASVLSGQASSSVKLQQSDVESKQDDSTVIGEDIEIRQRHSEHPL